LGDELMQRENHSRMIRAVSVVVSQTCALLRMRINLELFHEVQPF
jgi:hemerythrin-like domain-containing protein